MERKFRSINSAKSLAKMNGWAIVSKQRIPEGCWLVKFRKVETPFLDMYSRM